MIAIPKEAVALIVREDEDISVKFNLHPDQRWDAVQRNDKTWMLRKGKSGQIIISEAKLHKYFYLEDEDV